MARKAKITKDKARALNDAYEQRDLINFMLIDAQQGSSARITCKDNSVFIDSGMAFDFLLGLKSQIRLNIINLGGCE